MFIEICGEMYRYGYLQGVITQGNCSKWPLSTYTFTYPCDQRARKLTNHRGLIYASCCAENCLQ